MVVKFLFDLKLFLHKVNSLVVTSGTKVPVDPQLAASKTLNALYTAKSADFSLIICKGLKGSADKTTVNVFEDKESNKLAVIEYTRYVKMKDFTAVIVEKKKNSSFILLIFNDNGKKIYFEMYSTGKNTFTIDLANITVPKEDLKKNLKTGLAFDL
jgi:hypothetical protein